MLNLEQIKAIQAHQQYPSVTITLPTHRTAPDNHKDPIRLKNLLQDAINRLQEEFGKRDSADLVASIEALADAVDHEHNLDGLVIFANQDYAESFKLPYRLPERVAIDDNFLTRDLVFAMNRTPLYWVALLSETDTRLFLASKNNIHEVKAFGFPYSVSGAQANANPSQDISHVRDQIMVDLMRDVAAGLAQAQTQVKAPLVVVGVDRNIGHFKQGGTNSDAVLAYIAGGYTDKSTHELGQLLWPQVRDALRAERETIFEQIGAAQGNQRFVSGLNECWQAAIDGRVQTMVVEETLSIPAEIIENGRKVAPLASSEETGSNAYADIVDEMIEAVLAAGGEVVFTDEGQLNRFNPERGLVMITRY